MLSGFMTQKLVSLLLGRVAKKNNTSPLLFGAVLTPLAGGPLFIHN